MGWNLMASREQLLTARVNKLEFQLTNLEEAKNSMSNKMGNYQRLMNQEDQKQSIWDSFLLQSWMNGGNGSYKSPEYNGDWEQFFWPYAQCYMTESDIEAQKKQLQTQLQVAQAELKSVEQGKSKAIESSTVKYSA